MWRSWRAALWSVLLGPFVTVPLLFFAIGAVAYAKGTAVWVDIGRGSGWTFHHAYRCRRMTTGCFITGWEPFAYPANNLAIQALTGALGYMPGAYMASCW